MGHPSHLPLGPEDVIDPHHAVDHFLSKLDYAITDPHTTGGDKSYPDGNRRGNMNHAVAIKLDSETLPSTIPDYPCPSPNTSSYASKPYAYSQTTLALSRL